LCDGNVDHRLLRQDAHELSDGCVPAWLAEFGEPGGLAALDGVCEALRFNGCSSGRLREQGRL
jgi:hypothetical protein